jgi:hypothetical protein
MTLMRLDEDCHVACDDDDPSLLCAAAVFLLHTSERVSLEALALVKELVLHQPLRALTCLPTLTHLLRTSPFLAVRNHILHTLPVCGSHPAGAKILLHILQNVAAQPETYVLSIQLLAESSTHQSKLFGKLESILAADCPHERVPKTEVDMAKCQALLYLCEEDPDKGSDESMIKMIQSFLRHENPDIVSVALRCLTALCAEEYLAFYSGYKIVSKEGKINHLDHPTVRLRFAEFLAHGGDDDDEEEDVVPWGERTPAEARATLSVLKRLWRMVYFDPVAVAPAKKPQGEWPTPAQMSSKGQGLRGRDAESATQVPSHVWDTIRTTALEALLRFPMEAVAMARHHHEVDNVLPLDDDPMTPEEYSISFMLAVRTLVEDESAADQATAAAAATTVTGSSFPFIYIYIYIYININICMYVCV